MSYRIGIDIGGTFTDFALFDDRAEAIVTHKALTTPAAPDQAVLDAYGWSEIRLDHGFHSYRQMERWTVSPAARVEIVDRLLAENHRRSAKEAAQAKPSPKRRKAKAAPDAGEALFPGAPRRLLRGCRLPMG